MHDICMRMEYDESVQIITWSFNKIVFCSCQMTKTKKINEKRDSRERPFSVQFHKCMHLICLCIGPRLSNNNNLLWILLIFIYTYNKHQNITTTTAHKYFTIQILACTNSISVHAVLVLCCFFSLSRKSICVSLFICSVHLIPSYGSSVGWTLSGFNCVFVCLCSINRAVIMWYNFFFHYSVCSALSSIAIASKKTEMCLLTRRD